MAFTYTLISSQVLGSDASSVTFSSIPQTYNDLKVMMSVRATGNTSSLLCTFNGDSTNTYSWTNIQGANSAIGSSSSANVNTFDLRYTTVSSTDSATIFSSAEWYLSNYTTTSYKPAILSAVKIPDFTNGYGSSNVEGTLWLNTAAITSITFKAGAGNIAASSSFYLYGINNS